MTDNPGDAFRGAMAQNLDAARKAMTNYFQFVEKGLAASPLGPNHPAQALCKYIQSSVDASFDLSDKLLHASDLQDVLKIQTEFFQTRMQALAEQTRDFRDAASRIGLTGGPPST